MVLTASKILGRTVLSVLVLIFLTALILVAALSRGPVSLSFMAPYVEQIIADQYPNIDLGFEGLELQWDGRDKNLVFGITNMSALKDNETVAYIPAVTVTFSGDALLKGRVAPSGLEFTGLEVVLTRAENGGVRLGYSYTGGISGDAASSVKRDATPEAIHELFAELGRKSGGSDLTAYLERLEIYQFSIFVEDQKLAKSWKVTAADLVVWKRDDGLNGRLQGDMQVGEASVNLVFDASYDSASRNTVVRTNIDEFPLTLLAKHRPDLDILKGVGLSVSGDVNISLNAAFDPVQIGFVLGTGEGLVDLPDLYKKPLPIKSIALEGHSAAPFNMLNLNVVKIATQGPVITMSGTFENSENGFGLSIEGSSPNMEARDAATYWPYSAAADAYNWVTTKITEGHATDITFRVNLPAGALKSGKIPDGAIEFKFSFNGASADYFAPLPKVQNVKGKAILTEKQIHVFDLSGDVNGLPLPTGDVLLYDFDKDLQIADITLTAVGENRKIFDFIDKEPLGFATPYGIVPEKMTGVGKIEAQFVFPLKNDLTLEQVRFEAKGQFENASIPNVYEGYSLTGGNMAALVTPDKLTVKGNGNIQGTLADISFQSWFKGTQAGNRRYEIVAKLDDKARKDLKIIDTPYLTGSVGASLGVDLDSRGHANGVVTLNLVEAALDIPDLKLLKPVGVGGLFGAQFTTDGGEKSKLSNIRLSSENIELVGEAEIDKEGLKSFSASKLIYGKNDLSVIINRQNSQSYDVSVNGRVLDLQPYILAENPDADVDESDKDKNNDSEDELNINVNVVIEKALLDEKVTLGPVAGYVQYSGGLIANSEILAKLDGLHDVSFTVKQNGSKRDVVFKSAQAGTLLRGADIYDNSREGDLNIVAEIDDSTDDTVINGQVKIEKIQIIDAPVLGKILTVGSLTGIVELMQNDGMTFETIEGPFSYKNGVFQTKNFRAVGAIGLTFTGKVDKENDTLDGFGTVIPAYTLNSILGNIPILGQLLVGREGEGIFGFSYKLEGLASNPKVIVNPVSALAPGILRRMFFEPWTDAGSTDPNPTTSDEKSSETP
ncbi:MAG: AsmA-like C-terminal region-containing protein [Pseudomonas marincola]